MKCKFIFISIIVLYFTTSVFSQTPKKERTEPLRVDESLEFIASDLQKIVITIENLNKDIVKAYGNLSESMGLSLTDNQQKILVTFEILNRAEQRLGNLQKLRIDLIEKQTNVRSQLAEVDESLREESIERSVSLYGTTDAREIRDRRKAVLESKKRDFNNLLSEIQSTLSQTNTELIQTNQLVDQIRFRLFPAIYRELPRLDNDN